jgi:arsenate reductase-like glutaredoxin family protein
LRSLGLEFKEVNYAKRALTGDEVRSIVEAAGSVAAVLNLRHAVAKEQGWAQRPPSVDELVAIAATEPNVLRRPVLLIGGRAVIGFDREAYGKLQK